MSCGHFQTGRSYLAEMEHDDSRFFAPEADFPVVAGDTGKYWNSESEQKKRTPASEHDLLERKKNRALLLELRELEASQSSEALKVYEKFQDRLVTVAEKIFFLEIPYHERRDYLVARGFIQEPKPQAFNDHDRMSAVAKKDILYGMKKNDVMESWGGPYQVDIAGDPQNENERWLYKSNNTSKYIYFESGQVSGWE